MTPARIEGPQPRYGTRVDRVTIEEPDTIVIHTQSEVITIDARRKSGELVRVEFRQTGEVETIR
jgi:hypothetical protein